MSLQDKMTLYKLKKKYENFPGIRSFRIVLSEELTENEVNEIVTIRKLDSSCNERISIGTDRCQLIDWTIEKILPYLDNESEIIIGGEGGIAVYFENIEMFLDHYFKINKSLDIIILNRNLKKCIAVFEEEYFLEFFIRNI
ncbi:hypothetical protein U5N28_04770 [Lysinibacillus telephonicus]|uniref:hypothetical protein n=1 Tax=Lysinibacillus telephonicus TaxID=1714840 RepID=UPI00397CD085